jgi:hypothetical protein
VRDKDVPLPIPIYREITYVHQQFPYIWGIYSSRLSSRLPHEYLTTHVKTARHLRGVCGTREGKTARRYRASRAILADDPISAGKKRYLQDLTTFVRDGDG